MKKTLSLLPPGPAIASLMFVSTLALAADAPTTLAPEKNPPSSILLWPGGAPGSEGKIGDEVVRVTADGERVLSNVHAPSITPYLPAPDKATGAAVVIVPGGGHRELWADHEGHNVARWLSERGIAGFVLKYRLARETNSTYKVEVESLQDTQRAIRLVRSRAREWGVNPAHVGVMGFSAGGELAALASTRYDAGDVSATDPVERQSCKPDFQALVYPAIPRDMNLTNAPPAFLVCGANDRQNISEGLPNLYLALKRAGVSAELHVYADTGHGFGLREKNRAPVAAWPARFQEWLGQLRLLNKP